MASSYLLSPEEAFAEAQVRIAEEADRRTGALDLTDLPLREVPSALFNLDHLISLRLGYSGYSIYYFSAILNIRSPKNFSSFKKLENLLISSTDLKNSDFLKTLKNLKKLSLCNNQATDLAPLSGLGNLQYVVCSGTQVSDLAPLAGLSNLQQVDCSITQVNNLAPLAGLSNLQQVDCSGTRVSDLAPLAGLSNLQQVDCSGTRVSDLAPLAGLANLQRIGCNGTQVSDLAPLARLAKLQQVDCSRTQVSDLAPLARLSNLQQVDCSGTRVSDLAPLAGLAKLQWIDCSGTQVNDLAPLAGLANLHLFSCMHTQVKDLMPLSKCNTLNRLFINFCNMNHIPPEIVYHQSILSISAIGCTAPGIPHGLLGGTNCLPGLRAHFADLAQGTAELPDVKLLILGNGAVGKTQIARWLSGESFDAEWDSTHGIRVVGHPRSGSLAAEFHLQIWDFGGQDIYHGTHTLFLRGPAILMPVWTKSQENRDIYAHGGLTFRNHPLAYWLDVVRHQASPDNPVLIVQSQCDHPADEERRFPIPPETLAALPAATEIRLSAKVPRGGGALKDALTDATAMLRDPSRFGMPQIGVSRLRVMRRLEALRDADMALSPEERQHRLLTRQAYEAICEEEGGVSSPDLLLDFLHAAGTVFYRRGLFQDSIILDQGWALDKIYAVFDRKQAYKELRIDGGRFTQQKLGYYVWKDQSRGERELLTSMMRSCGICFLHRRFADEDGTVEEYIAPDLLPLRDTIADQLAARWDEERPSESATFSYGLLHGGLIRSIMSEIGEIAGCDGLYWRGGFSAYEATTRSRFLIEEEMGEGWEGRIRVRTQSGQADLLLQRLVTLIETVQDRLAMRPTAVERPVRAPAAPTHEPEPLTIVQEKPPMPEWYVSYAWADDRTPEGRQRAEIVDQLCATAEAKGRKILRDRNVLSFGDSISDFMRRIGTGDRVFVILSDKYLRSPYCMFELHEVWRTSRQEGPAFLHRVRVYALPDAKISDPVEWADWAIYWKQQHDALQSRAADHGIGILGEAGGRRLRQMQGFYLSVSDILGTLTDIVQPRTFADLERYGLDDGPIPA